MFDARILPLIRLPLRQVARGFKRLGVTANQITLWSFALGLMGAVAVVFNRNEVALVCLILNRIGDGIDGELARLTKPSDAGAYLDIVLDFLFYNAFVFAFILAEPFKNALPGALLMLSFMGTGASFLAFATLAEKRGIKNPDYPTKSFHYMNGLTEGAETIIVFVLFCLYPQHFALIAYSFAVLCFITTITRIWGGYRALR